MPLNNFDHLIDWPEFTTVFSRPSDVNEDAEIKVDAAVAYRTKRRGNAITIVDATVDIVTSTANSWVVSNKKADLLRKHEQGHFDITALGTRIFYNELLLLIANSTHALSVNIAALKQTHQGSIDRCNTRYDTQTNHGLITSVQDNWNQKIAAAKANLAGTITDLPS